MLAFRPESSIFVCAAQNMLLRTVGSYIHRGINSDHLQSNNGSLQNSENKSNQKNIQKRRIKMVDSSDDTSYISRNFFPKCSVYAATKSNNYFNYCQIFAAKQNVVLHRQHYSTSAPSNGSSKAEACGNEPFSNEAEYCVDEDDDYFIARLARCPPGSLGHLMCRWEAVLSSAAVPEALLSVQHIAAHVLGVDRGSLIGRLEEEAGEERAALLEELLQRRRERMPVQYIVGGWDFFDISLALRPPVFIPRPETELLVERVIAELQGLSSGRVLELCCGSGAVTLAVLNNAPNCSGLAVDRSPEATALTRENATALGLEGRCEARLHELSADSRLALGGEKFDLVVANPPYVLRGDMGGLQEEILWYEDPRALDGGLDGLDLVRVILEQAPDWLKPGGLMYLEVEPRHGQTLPSLITTDARSPWRVCEVIQDLHQRDRFVKLQLMGEAEEKL